MELWFDLTPGSNPDWKNHDPGCKFPRKVQAGLSFEVLHKSNPAWSASCGKNVTLTLCVKMHFMRRQQLMQSVREPFIVDVGEDVVNSAILKQVVLYA